LERFGHEVVYQRDQTCCGQPMADTGFNAEAVATEALFVRNFSGFDYVVAPEGSCVHFVRDIFDAVEQTAAVTEVRARTYELVEFLHDIEKADAFPWAKFPHRVGLHNKCVSLRRLTSRWICFPRSRGSSSSRRRGRMNAAAWRHVCGI
jgi:L-lactate dehydrogenase complex protein LldE